MSRCNHHRTFLLILAICLSWVPPLLGEWKEIGPTLNYQLVQKDFPIHLFKIDPRQWSLDILVASHYGMTTLTAKEFREKSRATLVINGGFFNEHFKSLGLLVRKSEIINPLRKADWGIFQIQEKTASIIHRKEWTGLGVITAIQVGPRLLISGKIPFFKPEQNPHRRSAVGITETGEILVALSESPLYLSSWAKILQQWAVSALSLDGGGSSQLSATLPGFSLEVPGTTGVPNVVAIFQKN